MLKKIVLTTLLLSGCTQFVQQTDEKYYEQIDNKSKSEFLNIAFSHNINGETHPCGCRNHPLGGIPQVAGAQQELKEKGPLLYVDTGDAFFPSPKVPKFIEKSIKYTAKKIAESFDTMGLNYFVPGDQDFALGQDFLVEIAKTHKFEFILSNASNHNKIKHKKFALVKFGNQQILLLGVVSPRLLPHHSRNLFISSTKGIENVLNFVDDKVGDISDMTIILLSHSGLDPDKALAQKFKNIDWIIGAHSQSFLRYSTDVNKTKIVQVLSRNHYLGHIKLPANSKAKAEYKIIEIRDDKKDKLKPNKYLSWLDAYKKELEIIQIKEQEELSGVSSSEVTPTPTAKSCLECHTPQTKFWQGTAHSLAYVTLEKANAENNPSCVGCHSLNYKKIDGFTHTKGIVKVSKKNNKKYWNEWSKTFKKVKSPRAMTPKARKKESQKWFKLDAKHQVQHNYANVQCLNCHTKSKDHPFEMDETKKTKNMSKMCIKCHTADQSPEWYYKDNKGIATSLNKKYFSKQLKKVACPKRNE